MTANFAPQDVLILVKTAALLGGQRFPFVGLGRRRLIPSLEQATFSVPVVTPTKEAISSQLTLDLMSSLICSIRSDVSRQGSLVAHFSSPSLAPWLQRSNSRKSGLRTSDHCRMGCTSSLGGTAIAIGPRKER
jgi:hypothetical protein